MSKPAVNAMVFKDEKGYLCAVRVDFCDEAKAAEIAKEKLIAVNVKRTNEYNYMYHGFGKAIGDDSYENTWWLTENLNTKSIPVYVFREDFDA